MPKQPTIAITGAGGFLGSALVKHFSAKGWRVVGLVRGAERYPKKKGVVYREYDLTRHLEDSLLADADYLVHTAFIKQSRAHPNAYDLNLIAARQLHDASRRHKLAKSVFISSMSAHEDAISVYGRQKLAIESIFKGAHDVCLRPGLIVGSGGIVKTMADFMRSKHVVPLIGGGTQPLQVIAIDELVTAVERALTTPVHGVFTVATTEVYSYKQFYQTLAKRLGVKVLFIPVPYSVLSAMLKTISALHLPLSVSDDNLQGLKKLRASDNAKDLTRLGIHVSSLSQALAHSNLTKTRH